MMKKISGVDTVELREILMHQLELFVDQQLAIGVSTEDACQAVREALSDVREEWC